MSSPSQSDVGRLGSSLATTKSTVYEHSSRLVWIGVCWFFASLPIVTVGPATVGAYAAIERTIGDSRTAAGERDRGPLAVARRQLVPSVVFSLFPILLAVGTAVFTVEFFATGSSTAMVLALGSFYAAAFVVIVLIPTFVFLARGHWAGAAIKNGYLWVVSHPTLALTTALLTLAVFVVTAALTIGFVLLFAALSFTLHLSVVPEIETEREDDRRSTIDD